MKRFDVLVAEPAENDLIDIGHHITFELHDPEAAQKIVYALEEAILSLENNPSRYALVLDESLAIKGIRKIVVGRHLLFYRINEKKQSVTVLRVLFGKRNWEKLL